MRCVQGSEIHTLSITRWASNALAQMCQENLYVATKTVQRAGRASYEMVAAFYLLLDICSSAASSRARREKSLPSTRRPAAVEALFNRAYPRMSENERYICQYIATHYEACGAQPIAAFARQCGVSPRRCWSALRKSWGWRGTAN